MMAEPHQARSVATLEKILHAAEAVVAWEGAAGLTMDGVAQEAGISKGGVLHHFRVKEALIARLATRRLESLRQEVNQCVDARDGETQKTLGGMIDHALATYGRDDGFSRAILVAAVENSQSLDQFRSLFTETFGRVRAESRHPDPAAALLFSVLGMQLASTLGLVELSLEQAERMFAALRGMAQSISPRA